MISSGKINCHRNENDIYRYKWTKHKISFGVIFVPYPQFGSPML